jgi:hypothetical protein
MGQLCRCMQGCALMVPPGLVLLLNEPDTAEVWCVWQPALSQQSAVSRVSLHAVGALLWHSCSLQWPLVPLISMTNSLSCAHRATIVCVIYAVITL